MMIAALVVLVLVLYLLLFRRSVFILSYHGVGKESSAMPGLVIRPEAFRRQMHLLSTLGFRSESIDSVVRQVFEAGTSRTRRLCVTFDDGYQNLLEHAIPWLAERGWSATIFVATDFVGGWNDWEHGDGFHRLRVMGWDQLEKATQQGIGVGSHGKTHRSLLELSDAECLRELEDSLRSLMARLSACSRVFCYPFGHRESRLASLSGQAGYLAACSLVAGALPWPQDRYDLGRMLVRGNSLLFFLLQLLAYPILSAGRQAWLWMCR